MKQDPGIHPQIKFYGITPYGREIIQKLSKVWFISHAHQEEYRNSDYTIAFAKPTDILIDRFHLGREVLVVITAYPEFEPRTLAFADKCINENSSRLDKLCVILVSRDPETKSKVRRICLEDKESRIMIPYCSHEVLDIGFTEETITSRMKEFFYVRDLFDFESPLHNDTYFFGRTQDIQYLYGKYKTGENGCLFGLRRIGKTSTLFALQRTLELREEPSVFLDCSNTTFHRRRWYETLHFITLSLVQAHGLTGKFRLNIPHFYDDKNASLFFEEDLTEIYKLLGNKRLLLIFDEIENITFDISPSEHWSKGKDFIFFWQSLRSLFQKNPNLFSFVIAGVNPKAIETPSIQGHDNPIYKFVMPKYLRLFDVNEVQEMVSSIGNHMGLHLEDEVFTYLVDDYGGHPFLIRQVCSYIHKSVTEPRPFTVTKFRYQTDRSSLNRRIQDYIDLIVQVLRERYAIEYELLEYLAQGDKKTFQDFAQTSPMIIEHLVGYGLVQEDNGQYHFKIKTVEEFIRQRTRIAKVLLTREDRWKEIVTRRGRFEIALRQVIKLALRLHFGAAKGKELFLESISPPDRKSKLSAFSFDQIFDESKMLYFDDLRKVICKNWEELGKIFNNDREHFERHMEYVNQHRNEAHANDIDDETVNILLASLQWLQRHVDQFLPNSTREP